MLTPRTASALCRDSHVRAPSGCLDTGPIANYRDAAICALYREGATLSSIGALFGMSYEGVRKVAAKAGLTKRNAGLAARNAAKPAVNKAESACRRTYGCNPQELSEATADERRAFLQHRKNVRRDSVDWQLSLSEWRAVWRASGKWNRRGQGPGKYGMTRIDFDAPVELGNVQVVTNREAVRRARLLSSSRSPQVRFVAGGRAARLVRGPEGGERRTLGA
jgi:hypothetical protein